uniref:Uncharacterized protein n=1 Tax=Romanomermis culicivorax TaxID=13658 RepID=A0A915K3X0_ROMCU
MFKEQDRKARNCRKKFQCYNWTHILPPIISITQYNQSLKKVAYCYPSNNVWLNKCSGLQKRSSARQQVHERRETNNNQDVLHNIYGRAKFMALFFMNRP